ncbi:hypothetical protein BJ085DRAFT_38756 [Dimargaris cristalligena]|uniref:RlpA-like double-psi beta-barrel-protein domain-containing protein-containing protein n=1 Tax=Dimargaris cristalligena TaxID=215637 RepID=A0A4P9ZTH5_9FUNG|nr:hypothetical protein BJ085DRAFT_38756 [Dimargaris cristalligena]|eukprot:RKP36884.1 hypothetical protein BJ085DRAFT_38756 [Dimargaris cristalligena]
MKFTLVAALTTLAALANASSLPNNGLVKRQDVAAAAPVNPTPAPVVVAPVPAPAPAPPVVPAPVAPAPVVPVVAEVVVGQDIAGKASFEDAGPKDVGSCGTLEELATLTVSINKGQMADDIYPGTNPKCFKMMSVQSVFGTSVQAKITDTCEDCEVGEVVLSQSAANALGPKFVKAGRSQVTWKIIA